MKLTILASTLLLSTAALLPAENVSGLWKWTTKGQNGGADRIYNLKVEASGSQLTGSILSPNRTNETFSEFKLRDGTLNGDELSFATARNSQRGTNVFLTHYHGKLSGDQIEGTIISPGRGGRSVTNLWKAERNTTGKLVSGPIIVVKPGYNENGQKIVNETHYKELKPDAIAKYIAEHPDAVILDTRSADEFAEGHIPNSQNHDLTNEATYKEVLSKLDKNKAYVVLSAGGHYRTVRALEYFEANGFREAVALDGGFNAWADAGKPVSTATLSAK